MTSYADYATDTEIYPLSDGFALHKAVNAEYITWWSVYRDVNDDFVHEHEQRLADLEGVPFCFWVTHDQRRVGGVVMLPNNIGDLFLVPPFNDWHGLLAAVLPILHHWSDDAKPIHAQSILDSQAMHLLRAGFRIVESRRFMIRPTGAAKVDLSPYELVQPASDHADALADLFLAAFRGGAGLYGQRSREQHLESIQNAFANSTSGAPCYHASVLAIDPQTNRIAAACLVDRYKTHPSPRFIAVHPDFQRQGIARRLTQHVIAQLHSNYRYVVLSVTVGNPAESLYYNLGFLPGPITHQLIYSARITLPGEAASV